MFYACKKNTPLILSIGSISLIILNMFSFRYPHIEQLKLLSENDVSNIDKIMEERRSRISDVCQKYSGKKILHSPSGRYLNRMRLNSRTLEHYFPTNIF